MKFEATAGFTGSLKTKVIRRPKASVIWKIKNFPNVWSGLWRHELAKLLNMNHMTGRLSVLHIKKDGTVIDYGLVSTKLVTTAFVNFMVDQLQAETSEWGDFKYHDSGEGTTGAAVGDTDIETTDGESRATGTQTEGASANIYKSVGTISYTTTKSITEHGIFSQSTGTTLLDRHTFTSIGVENGDSIEFTYELTCTAGG